ncbi:hypothetical protein BT96DRAFT_1014799 [Gymnopus androsaceus JB14]|uniref:Uncharacterized protein n=1 Tax=Gymnopus androsaceus JB14 TaxID=1447944 RepID=A0A6A4I7A0_9AGAR|nr:hypothetical protein BT96DRAFT_1014799 [Gymnopus androsaceus JB14]
MNTPKMDPLADSNCPTCGTSNFSPRLDLEAEVMKDRFRSEYDPTSCAEIKETLSLLDKDYEGYTSEITRLELQIRSLSSRLQLQVEALLFRQGQLPNEIIMSIFNYVSRNNLLRERRHSKKHSLRWLNRGDGLTAIPALVLSSVCFRWRGIALSCSAIWSRVSLVLDVERSAESQGFLAMVKLYMERSGSSSLRLIIKAVGDNEDGLLSLPALLLIGQHVHRLQYLTLHSPLSCGMFFLPNATIRRFPMLEKLEYYASEDEEFQGVESLQVFGETSSPKLKSFRINVDIIEQFSAISLHQPLHQLTTLDVVLLEQLDNLDRIVEFCPKLTSLL